jgi:hypothetical protein
MELWKNCLYYIIEEGRHKQEANAEVMTASE